MFNCYKNEKFSLRKYKDGRTDSKLIGATILAAGIALSVGVSPVAADVTSNGVTGATMVTDTSKIPSSSATTFTDDQDATKKVKVDAVLQKDTTEPKKANANIGEADGNDIVNFKSEATVDYKLDSDKSLLKTETVETGTGAVTTPYDKKGLAYDTDGKDYRESTVTKTGKAVSETTGKKDTVEANNKVYEYVRSEVKNADKDTYDKTTFNNIEAEVSPEGMHTKLGEIDYTRTKGRVYLVEETSDGQYGKYVVAENGVANDDDAATKWNEGLANAKDFTKENVELEEGDTILVLDKDTFAVGEGKKIETKRRYYTTTYTTMLAVDTDVNTYQEERVAGGLLTYAYEVSDIASEVLNIVGTDGVFGTTDDVSTSVNNVVALTLEKGVKDENTTELPDTPDLDYTKASLGDILKDLSSTAYRTLDYFNEKTNSDADKAAVKDKVVALNARISKIEEMIKSNNVGVGIKDGKLVLYHENRNIINNLQNEITSIPSIIGNMSVKHTTITKVTPAEIGLSGVDYEDRVGTRTVKETYTNIMGNGIYKSGSDRFYRPEASGTSEKYYENGEPIVEETTLTDLTPKGKITVVDKNTITADTFDNQEGVDDTWNQEEKSIAQTVTYTKKEVITPIRAYKVMGEAKPVVTHYYNLKITKEEAGVATATKQGSVVIKYVNNDGKQLKSETDKDNVTLETKTIVSLYSGETKVDERTDIATVEQSYDTTSKQYPTLVDTDTGFTYEYVGLKQGSPAASGKVVEGTTEVVYEYRLVSNEEATPSKSEVKKTGSVDVTHVFKVSNGKYKTLKTEVVKDKVALEYEDTYVTYSGNVKVSERKATRTVEENYDTADKQYPTLKDTDTGFTYKYVGLKEGSASASGKVVEGNTHVVYEYALVSEEEKSPSKRSRNCYK